MVEKNPNTNNVDLAALAAEAFSVSPGRKSSTLYYVKRIETEEEGTAWSRSLSAEAIVNALRESGWALHPDSGDGIYILYKKISQEALRVAKIINTAKLTRIVWKTVPIPSS